MPAPVEVNVAVAEPAATVAVQTLLPGVPPGQILQAPIVVAKRTCVSVGALTVKASVPPVLMLDGLLAGDVIAKVDPGKTAVAWLAVAPSADADNVTVPGLNPDTVVVN